MKTLPVIFLFLFPHLLFPQQRNADFRYIDWKVMSIEATAPDTLAYLLTESYEKDIEKVRSIFRWITEHIAYRVKNPYGNRETSVYIPGYTDSSFMGESIHETIAKRVLQKKAAVCDGYSRLFKTLCDYAGIRSEIVTGYVKTNMGRAGAKFRSNHNWNAVLIDSAWHLLDVTWASGFFTFRSDEFIKQYNNHYFLTPPEEFIRDHFPDDLQWTLLPDPPILKEFDASPFKQKSFSKYNIISYRPSTGVIEAAIGDTVQILLESRDPVKDKRIVPDEFFDTTMLYRSPSWAFIYPGTALTGKKINYTYIVESGMVEWLHLMYNSDLIMRYKLKIKKN